MVDHLDINNSILLRLRERAERDGLSVDDLLSRLLDEQPSPLPPPELSQRLLEYTGDTIVLFDTDLRYVYVNLSMAAQLGFTPEQMVGKTDAELGMSAEMVQFFRESWQVVKDTKREKIIEFEANTVNGLRQFESRLTPICDSDGKLEYLLAITRDVTESRQAEAAAHRTQNILQRIFDNSHFLLAYMDADFNFIQVNERYAEADNHTPDFFIGKNHFELYPDPENEAIFRHVIETGQAVTIYAKPFLYPQRPDRGITYWDWSLIPVQGLDEAVEGLVFTLFDVTEHLRVEQELRVKDRAIETSITAIALADLDGIITYVNDAFVKLWKLESPQQAVGRSGLEIWVSRETAQQALNYLKEHDNYIGEMTALLMDGSFADIQMAASIVRDAANKPICIMGSFIDITSHKQSEQFALENERLKARFQKEQERNALVQRVISALSHDLRTPLTVISTSRDVLSRYGDRLSPEKREEKLETIRRQVQFALELLEDTVNLIRGQPLAEAFQPSPINLDTLCRVIVQEVGSTSPYTQRLKFVNLSATETVNVDEVLVSRILLNLLTNAIKYSPDNSDIRLELDRRDNVIILRVRDQGMGISTEDLPHIFDPFFRAKGVDEIRGTGLGLSIVKDCVERHQGRVLVESTPGNGSTFTVELPLADAGAGV